jgi:hypothetical protein
VNVRALEHISTSLPKLFLRCKRINRDFVDEVNNFFWPQLGEHSERPPPARQQRAATPERAGSEAGAPIRAASTAHPPPENRLRRTERTLRLPRHSLA